MRSDGLGNTHSTAPRYNTKAVVRETGVPADTFRAWERRYGMPMPHRTDTGQRLYSDHDVAVIRWLRDQTAAGLTISQAVRLLDGGGDGAAAAPPTADWGTLQTQLLDALLRLQVAPAEAVLGQAFAHYALEEVCLKLIQPVLVTIGSSWEHGTVSAGQEHFATNFLRRRLQALLAVYDVSAGVATIVAACAPGEHHDVGLLMVSMVLIRRGYRIIYLGADVPIEGLVPVVEQAAPDLVCLSATLPETAVALGRVADALSRLPDPPLVAAGGQGVQQMPATGLPYTRLDGDAVAAADQIVALIDRSRSKQV